MAKPKPDAKAAEQSPQPQWSVEFNALQEKWPEVQAVLADWASERKSLQDGVSAAAIAADAKEAECVALTSRVAELTTLASTDHEQRQQYEDLLKQYEVQGEQVATLEKALADGAATDDILAMHAEKAVIAAARIAELDKEVIAAKLALKEVDSLKACIRHLQGNGLFTNLVLERDAALGSGTRKKGDVIATVCCAEGVTMTEVTGMLRNPQLHAAATMMAVEPD